MKELILTALLPLTVACAVSSHPVMPAQLGTPATMSDVRQSLTEAGPIEFERIVAAGWAVDRSGLVNFDHPKAQHLEDTLENIEIYVYRITHPKHGTFLIDTGIGSDLADGDSAALSRMVAGAMNTDKLTTHITTADIVRRLPGPLQGVFLTHLHLDHVFGMPDIDDGIPIYTGAGEAGHSKLLHVFVRGTTDRLLAGKGPLREWVFDQHEAIDVFGDGSLWVLNMPGHTPGSVAFVIRTVDGPVLLTGDTCHTGFGWRHNVEPGSFTANHKTNRSALMTLKSLAQAVPEMRVYLGHQRVGQQLSAYRAIL